MGDEDERIGDQVRSHRLLAGMTRAELGEAVGVSFQQVQKYEQGTTRISATRLQQVARALGVAVTDFYDAEVVQDGAGRDASDDPGLAAENLRLARAFMRIPDPTTRQRIVDLLETLAPAATDRDPG